MIEVTSTVHAAEYAIMHMVRQLKIIETVNDLLVWDEAQWSASPGLCVAALIVDILAKRSPLYRVTEFYSGMDVSALFGPNVTAKTFNDDLLGRALDRLYEAGMERVFSSVAFKAIEIDNVPVPSVHADTTSISVWGEYLGVPPGQIKVTRGYSKDKRPDLKQFLVGLITTPEGVPFFAKVLDGNTSDKQWNQQILKKFNSILDDRWGGATLVADSAMVTKENLSFACKQGVKFISRLPATFKEHDFFKSQAWSQDNWQMIGQLSPGKKAATYRAQTFTGQISGKPYVFHVYHSDTLDKRKQKTIAKQIEQERKSLEKAAARLTKQKFACEADAQAALELFGQEHESEVFTFVGRVDSFQDSSYGHRGRPRKGEKPIVKTYYKVNLTLDGPNPDAVRRLQERASTFILITNHLNTQEWPAQRVLQEYKGQTAVETKFRVLKDPVHYDATFLKKPSRIEALISVILMAILVYTLFERRVRKALQELNEEIVIFGRHLTKPTGEVLLQALRGKIIGGRFVVDGNTTPFMWSSLKPLPAQIFQLARIDIPSD